MKTLINFLKNEQGNHVLEYTSLAVVVAGGCIVGIKTVKDGMLEQLVELSEATDVNTEGDAGGEGG